MTGTIKKPFGLKFASHTVTLSTEQYNGFYYADITTPQSQLVNLIVTTTTSNSFACVQQISPSTARVYGAKSGASVTVVSVHYI